MRRQVLERWSAGFGACAVAGAFYHYSLLAVSGPNAKGLVETLLRETVNRHADAPYQYRFLVPCVLVWISDHMGVSLPNAATGLDAAMLAIGALLGVALLRRSGFGLFALPALLYCAFLILGPTLYYKPETLTAFACATAALLSLQRRPEADGWWSTRVTTGVLIAAAVLLIGCRTDLLLALGVAFAVRWWQKRERFDLFAAGLLVMTSLVATETLVRVFPEARYPHGVGLVEVRYNLDALTACVLAVFLAVAIGPLVFLREGPRTATAVRAIVSERLPLLALIAAEVASTFVVGRIDEIRLIFPLGFALAWIGVDLWRAALTSIDPEDPRSTVAVGSTGRVDS